MRNKVEIIVQAATEQASKAMRMFVERATSQFKTMGKTISDIGSKLFSLKGIALQALAGWGVKELAKGFLGAASSMEQFRTVLGTVLKSEYQAADLMEWISAFAAKTPFQISELAEAATRLSAYGLNAKQSLRTLGDASSSMGKNIMQAVEMVADASQGEFERMKEFGLRAVDVATRAGFESVQEMTASRENLTKGVDTLMQILDERFAGGMEKISGTIKGMWSNLLDWFARFKNMVMDAGIFEYLKEKLSETLGKINELAESGQLQVWAQQISTTIVGLFQQTEKFFKEKWPEIKQHLENIGPLLRSIATVAGAVGKAFYVVGSAIGQAAAKVVEFYEKATDALARAGTNVYSAGHASGYAEVDPPDENTTYAGYDAGTPYVPRTGIYRLHQGEAVVPATRNMAGMGQQAGGMGLTITGGIHVHGLRDDNAETVARKIDQELAKMVKYGRSSLAMVLSSSGR